MVLAVAGTDLKDTSRARVSKAGAEVGTVRTSDGSTALHIAASDGRAAIDVDKPRDLDDVLALIARKNP